MYQPSLIFSGIWSKWIEQSFSKIGLFYVKKTNLALNFDIICTLPWKNLEMWSQGHKLFTHAFVRIVFLILGHIK